MPQRRHGGGGALRDAQARRIKAITHSGLNWTIARITNPTDRPRKGTLRAGFLGYDCIGLAMTRHDIADFLVDQLDEVTYRRAAPAVSN